MIFIEIFDFKIKSAKIVEIDIKRYKEIKMSIKQSFISRPDYRKTQSEG
jgi:hypothetical protein